MSKISKPDVSLRWAQTGSKATPNDTTIQRGWVVEKPPYQVMNWVQNRQDESLAYTFQLGIPEWDDVTEYQYSANNYATYVQKGGIVYKAIQTGTNKNPATETAYWTRAFDDYGVAATVQTNLNNHLTNYATLSGISNLSAARTNLDVYSKSQAAQLNGSASELFSVAPATLSYHAVRKDQLDTKAQLNGSALELFSVAPAIEPYQALQRAQLLSSMPDDIKIFLLRLMYPTGTPYFNKSDDRSPNLIFGVNFGTWVRESGRYLVGFQSGDADFGTAGAVGGKKGHKMTLDNLIEHRHEISHESSSANSGAGMAGGVLAADYNNYTTYTGSNNPDPIPTLSPYVVYHWWVRTA